ncbi:MAG: IclR family transcriptional regulator [Bowdeniella nasicola]|nr:IclR family transcriptional regulator [Bowdeniella nasicola]
MCAARDSRTAVDKAMALLRAFGDEGSVGVGVSELARRCDLSKSTAFRLLGILARNGAVERAGSSYRLGPMLFELAEPEPSPHIDLLNETLTPYLAKLFEVTRQTVHLAVLSGHEVFYLNKLHAQFKVSSPSRIGGRVPAYCTAVGKMMLAYDHDATEQILRGDLEHWTPHTITDPDKLRAELETIRETNIAYDRQEIMMGLNCIAAPVMSPARLPVASFSVSGRVGVMEPERYEQLLRKVCFEAGKAIAARHRRRNRP